MNEGLATKTKSKNLRLSFAAWQDLRLVKFKLRASTYSEVLTEVLKSHKGESAMSDDIRYKSPSDIGDHINEADMDRADKTVVVSEQIHNQILDMKTEYIIKRGYASRGPNAVSVSDILLELLNEFKIKKNLK